MTSAALCLPTSYLQQARACLGICRHCFGNSTSAQACHSDLPDVIVSLEIAVLLLGDKSGLAHDHLCHCAKLCAHGAAEWANSPHPCCRQSAKACQSFASFLRGEAMSKARRL